MHEKIKIIGIQRSGTNYLSTILENNYDIVSIDTGQNREPGSKRDYFWKHSYNPDQYIKNTDNSPNIVQEGLKSLINDKVPTILISKNPYFWLESIKRNPGDIGKEGISFVDWNQIQPKQHKSQVILGPYGQFDLENVCQMWTDFHRYWINNKFDNLKFVKYEDLLINPKRVISDIEETFGLKNKVSELVIPKKVHMSTSFNKNSISRSIEQTKPRITDKEKHIMTDSLSHNIIRFLGYEVLTH
jgi:hypothetical protein